MVAELRDGVSEHLLEDVPLQELGDCRVSRPVAEPVAYEGPCGWGWVKASSIELLAG